MTAIKIDAVTNAISRSLTTRVLHLLLLSAVLCQLVSSHFEEKPLPGEAASPSFSLHEYVGLGSLAIVGAFWLWAAIRHGETRLGRPIPWLSLSARKAFFVA